MLGWARVEGVCIRPGLREAPWSAVTDSDAVTAFISYSSLGFWQLSLHRWLRRRDQRYLMALNHSLNLFIFQQQRLVRLDRQNSNPRTGACFNRLRPNAGDVKSKVMIGARYFRGNRAPI